MKRLIHSDLKTEILFEENTINIWVIESKKYFNILVKELISQSEGADGRFVFSFDNEIVQVKDHIEVIADIYTLDFTSKRIKAKINKILKGIAEEETLPETNEIKTIMERFLISLIDKTDLNLEFEQFMDIGDLIKLFDVNPIESYEGILDSLIGYLKLSSRLFPDSHFIFINLKQFLEDDEIKELYSFVIYEKISILLIENQQMTAMEHEKYLILDKDLCII